MVKIKSLIIIILIFFSNYAHSYQKKSIIRDAEIEFFLHKIIQTILDGTDINNIYYPRLVSNDEYNAFVTGSNKIYINTGLINKSNSLSEIQGILAHEIGHLVLNHHNTRSINKKKLSNYSKIVTIAGIALSTGGKLGTNSVIGLAVGSQDLVAKSSFQFSRIQEQQADKFAFDIMRKRNISLEGLEQLLVNLSNKELFIKSSHLGYYRSHPFSIQRLNQLKKYKPKVNNNAKKINNILIYNNSISLEYIKNKIKSYNTEPFEILKKKSISNEFSFNYSQMIANYKVGKYNSAALYLKKLQNDFSDYPFFFELSGDINYAKGSFEIAISEYKKAINTINTQFYPSIELIKLSLVKSYLQTNDVKNINKSIIILEELLQNNPKWSYLWRLLAKSSGKINKKAISYIALAEEFLIKKDFNKARKYVYLANKQPFIPNSYKLRGLDILARINMNK